MDHCVDARRGGCCGEWLVERFGWSGMGKGGFVDDDFFAVVCIFSPNSSNS